MTRIPIGFYNSVEKNRTVGICCIQKRRGAICANGNFDKQSSFCTHTVFCIYSYSICQHIACFMPTVTYFSVCMHFGNISLFFGSLRSAK